MGRILVHICCSVDSIYSIKKIKDLYPNNEIIGFFYNPNIHPYSEYQLRKIDTEYICKINGIEMLDGEYDFKEWYSKTSKYAELPEKSERCVVCHYNVLDKCAEKAQSLGIQSFTTTLYMSPLKSKDYLTLLGLKVSKKYGINFLEIDLKKGGATEKTIAMVNEFDIYRQEYCGCIFAAIKHREDNWIFDFSTPINKKLYPGSKEFFEYLYTLRCDMYLKGFKTKIIKEKFINWRTVKAIFKVNNIVVSGFEIEPYSSSSNGIFQSRVVEIKNGITLKKDEITILNSSDVFVRGSFNSDIVVRYNGELSIGDKVSLELKNEFNYSSTNYSLQLGSSSIESREINVYSSEIKESDILELLQKGQSLKVISSFY